MLRLYETGYPRLPGYFGSNVLMIHSFVSKTSVTDLGNIFKMEETNILLSLISVQLLSEMFTTTEIHISPPA